MEPFSPVEMNNRFLAQRTKPASYCLQSNCRNDMVILGIFDGHGENGGIASKDVRSQLVQRLRDSNGILWNQIRQDPEQAIKNTFADIDMHLGRRYTLTNDRSSACQH